MEELTGVKIEGRIGTWSEIDSYTNPRVGTWRLMESDQYGDMAEYLIIDDCLQEQGTGDSDDLIDLCNEYGAM